MITISLEEMKNYLRMNGFEGFPTEEDILLQDLIDSAIEDVKEYVNQELDPVPVKLKTTAMKIVAIQYENRVEDTKDLIDSTLKGIWQFRKWPGC